MFKPVTTVQSTMKISTVIYAKEGQGSFFIVPLKQNKNSTQWVHESNASWIVSAVEIC